MAVHGIFTRPHGSSSPSPTLKTARAALNRLDNRRIRERADVSKRVGLTLGNLAENTPHHLARTRLGESWNELVQVDPRVSADMAAQDALQFALERLVAGAEMLRTLWWSAWVESAG